MIRGTQQISCLTADGLERFAITLLCPPADPVVVLHVLAALDIYVLSQGCRTEHESVRVSVSVTSSIGRYVRTYVGMSYVMSVSLIGSYGCMIMGAIGDHR